MSNISRIVSGLSAITVATGVLPQFSWSLASFSASSASPPPPQRQNRHLAPARIPIAEACRQTSPKDLRAHLGEELKVHQKSILFVGEQHENASILAAQLTILDEIVRIGKETGRKVFLVLEQFNVLQQPSLDSLAVDLSLVSSTSSTITSAAEAAAAAGDDRQEREVQEKREEIATRFVGDYQRDGEEGFSMWHYLPLLVSAWENDVVVKGGFPPRSWAKMVSKEGVEALRAEKGGVLRELGFDNWLGLRGSRWYQAFVRSLVRDEAPALVDDGCGGTVPGGSSSSSMIQKGLFPAQCFKDSMLAHVIDGIVRKHGEEVLIMVVTGNGHCEYGFGAPERLGCFGRDRISILVCKSRREGFVWKGGGWGVKGGEDGEDGRVMADAVLYYD